ncbi:hypothetical protein K435DRAFT_898411 [Dendrothele bispora CBS 962.96]|uniref:Uncharacterized protein n=1 Tax=Dendrothele bispora (strain CBS 962.96) TaxID=1314807 RepID=A0A4S8LYV4_DENBC|nr:hypothetical protein K435DRAFT_898411 [Dendrothele bispora CBS 962.96]
MIHHLNVFVGVRDAVALNIGSDYWQFEQLESAYDAAISLEAATTTSRRPQANAIKLFISFDYTAFPCDVSRTIDMVNYFRDHPAQFKYDGKPMISSYSGTCLGVDGWKRVRNETGGYLMPFTYEDYQELREGRSWGIFDSWYCWGCAWPQGNYSKNVSSSPRPSNF